MAIANILVNGFPGSNDNIVLDASVTLANSAAASTYLWTIVSQPSGSPNAVLSSETASVVTFTANKEGSYLIRLVVDAGLPGEASDQVIVAVRELQTGNRIPAAGETTENNSSTGWANTAVDEILQRVTRFTDQGVLVGTAGAAGLLPLDVVYAADVVTIATGLPGEREVPEFQKALATTDTKVRGLVGVVLGGVDGSPAPAEGSLIRVAVMTLVQSVPLGYPSLTDGTPIYVSDTATISADPGTVVRQIGTVLDDMGGNNYGVWITGTGTFGTLQSISAVSPLEVTDGGGVSPQLSLAYADGLTLDDGSLVVMQATATEYGTVKLAGGLGGTSSTADLPVLAVGTGYVSGVLPATNGGTGLSTSSAADAFLVGNGSGGWTTRTNFAAGGILSGPLVAPTAIVGLPDGVVLNYVPFTHPVGSTSTVLRLTLPRDTTSWLQPYYGTPATHGGNLVIASGDGVGGGSPKPPGNLTLRGGERVTGGATGGEVTIRGGAHDTGTAAPVLIAGGAGQFGGYVRIDGGNATAGVGGAVFIEGGTSAGGEVDGGDVSITGGAGAGEGLGGTVTVEGGTGYNGGDVIIQPGNGSPSADGYVRIRRRTGAASGQVLIDDAFVNGTGTIGQVLTSNGVGTPPSWQGSAGGTASQGAFRSVTAATTVTTNDYLVFATGPAGYTVTLPVASTIAAGRIFGVKAGASSGGGGSTKVLAVAAGDNIEGSTNSITLSPYQMVWVMRTDTTTPSWIYL